MMDPLMWITLTVVWVVGILVGLAINRDYGRAFERRAQRAEATVREYTVELERLDQTPVYVPPAALPVAPVVHVHLTTPSAVPVWAQPPVLDAQVLPALGAARGDVRGI
ncbi:MAG: hypothetical protein ACRDTZ_00035 [Pseudonocardiaceae bacterium]